MHRPDEAAETTAHHTETHLASLFLFGLYFQYYSFIFNSCQLSDFSRTEDFPLMADTFLFQPHHSAIRCLIRAGTGEIVERLLGRLNDMTGDERGALGRSL